MIMLVASAEARYSMSTILQEFAWPWCKYGESIRSGMLVPSILTSYLACGQVGSSYDPPRPPCLPHTAESMHICKCNCILCP